MIYDNIKRAVFLSRPNRFIANILVDGRERVCHVKNTGRCKELLIPGCEIYVQEFDSEKRKTAFDLIAVRKGARLINMDAAAPNKVFHEWLAAGGLGFSPELIRPEYSKGHSRFDFFFSHHGREAYAEIKGVTLENEGVVRFPDAPTERGLKHIKGLTALAGEGLDCYAVFVVQMDNVKYFAPNWETHREFGEALRQAEKAGVHVLALDCAVTESSLKIADRVEVRLG